MLPLFVLIAAIVFIVIWKMGLLDDLRDRNWDQERGPWIREPRRLKRKDMDPEMASRLEIFKEFLEDLSDEEDPNSS